MNPAHDDRTTSGEAHGRPAPERRKLPYEPPRVLTDEAFEQISLSCSTKMGTHKNFT